MSKFGDRMKMFRQAESLAMERDRMKRRSLAYSAFEEEVNFVGHSTGGRKFVQIYHTFKPPTRSPLLIWLISFPRILLAGITIVTDSATAKI